MGFPILVRWHLYIESAPWSLHHKSWYLLQKAHSSLWKWAMGPFCEHTKILSIAFACYDIHTLCVNSLRPNDTTWLHRTWSTLVQVMAWCLMAPNHYLNQYWLIINEILLCSPEGNFTGNAYNIYPWYLFENYCKISNIRCTKTKT